MYRYLEHDEWQGGTPASLPFVSPKLFHALSVGLYHMNATSPDSFLVIQEMWLAIEYKLHKNGPAIGPLAPL